MNLQRTGADIEMQYSQPNLLRFHYYRFYLGIADCHAAEIYIRIRPAFVQSMSHVGVVTAKLEVLATRQEPNLRAAT